MSDAMTDLRALVQRSEELDLDKHDHQLPNGKLSFDDGCNLTLTAEGEVGLAPVALTDHAAKQLYAKLGPGHFGRGSNKALPYDYMQAHAPVLRAKLLNLHARSAQVADNVVLARCYQQSCRAVLHGNYPVIPNTDLLTTVIDAIGEAVPPGMKLVRPWLDPDRLLLKIMWADTSRPDNGGGSYGIGTYIGNDEVGSGRIKIWPLVQRTSCENSIVFRPLKAVAGADAFDDDASYDEEKDQRGDFVGLSLVHRGDRARLALLVKSGIGQSLGAGAAFVDQMIVAETQRLPNFTDILGDLAAKYQWSDGLRDTVAMGSEGKQTLAGMINGVTHAAQTLSDPEAQLDMEVLGGSILVSPDSIFGQAARSRRERVPVVVR